MPRPGTTYSAWSRQQASGEVRRADWFLRAGSSEKAGCNFCPFFSGRGFGQTMGQLTGESSWQSSKLGSCVQMVRKIRESRRSGTNTHNTKAMATFFARWPVVCLARRGPESLILLELFVGQTLSRTLCFHIYGGWNVYFERDMEKPEALLTFLRGQDARYGSSESRPALN